MTTASNWLLNWAIAYSTPYLVNSGPGNANLQSKVFFIWGGFCFVCIAFIYFFLYETKGLALEQVDELYAKCGKAWQSKAFRPTVRFADVQEYAGQDARRSTLADLEAGAIRRKSTAAGAGDVDVHEVNTEKY
jgi:MFS transporter, SP family, sugar:H+ symporter